MRFWLVSFLPTSNHLPVPLPQCPSLTEANWQSLRKVPLRIQPSVMQRRARRSQVELRKNVQITQPLLLSCCILFLTSIFQFSSVQSLSCVRLFVTPWIAARQASLSITNSRSSLRFTSIESVVPSSHLTLCRPLLLLPPIPPSIRVFSNESTLRMRWPKDWSFSFSIIPSKEHQPLAVSKNSLNCFLFFLFCSFWKYKIYFYILVISVKFKILFYIKYNL